MDRGPGLVKALERLLDPFTRGDPQGPLRWTCSSAARLAEQLGAEGHRVSERTVNRLLHELGYSLQANRKTLEGRQHPDRDAQFRRIARRVRAFQRLGQPVASIDTKKKELVGRYRNGGREWRPKGQPEAVKVRIPLKWIRDSDDLDHGFRRSGALVGAERRLVSQSPPSESYREIGTCPWRRR